MNKFKLYFLATAIGFVLLFAGVLALPLNKEESLMDFPNQEAFTPFSYHQPQRKGYIPFHHVYIFGIKRKS